MEVKPMILLHYFNIIAYMNLDIKIWISLWNFEDYKCDDCQDKLQGDENDCNKGNNKFQPIYVRLPDDEIDKSHCNDDWKHQVCNDFTNIFWAISRTSKAMAQHIK